MCQDCRAIGRDALDERNTGGTYTGNDVYTLMKDAEAKLTQALALAQMYQNESAERGERIEVLKEQLERANV